MFTDLPTFEGVAVTLIVTAIRVIVEASPTILGGVVVAAWLRTLATPAQVKHIFRGHGIQGTLRTVLVGMTLPVCSIGVLPVLRELRRLGLPTSRLITLGIVAPLLNPISLLYALTVLSGTQLLLVTAAATVLAIIVSDVSARFAKAPAVTAEPRPAGLTGATRLRNLMVAATRIATGWPPVDLMIVVVVSAVAASLVPPGTPGNICDVSNQAGPVIASLLALPQYVGPAHGIIQQVGIEKARLSISTGLALYIFGTGFSAANILLFYRWYGVRRIAAVAVAMFLFVSTTAYASRAVVQSSAELTEETAGLDNLARPATAAFRQIGTAIRESLKFTDPLMMMAAMGLLITVVAGGVVRFAKIRFHDDDPEAQTAENAGRMSQAVPASQLGAVAVCGIAIVFCLTTYIFFPGPTECMEDMQAIQMDANIAIRQGRVSEALQQIDAWDSVAAKLPVSAAVHFSFPTPSQRQATRDLRMALHSTRMFLRDGDMVSARKQIPDLTRLLSETKVTFDGGSS